MHYTDDEQIEKNLLEIVIYIHGHCDDDKGQTITVPSIQNCKYFSPRILSKILKDPDKYFKNNTKISTLKQEEWFLVKIKQIDWNNISIESIQNVSEEKEDILRLH